ncbi:hypothetical protein EJB05_15868, partial [Eragrostis curvula]
GHKKGGKYLCSYVYIPPPASALTDCIENHVPRHYSARHCHNQSYDYIKDDVLKFQQIGVAMGSRTAFVVAFLLRAIYGGMQIVTKDAFNEGMSTYVFVFYRHATAILFLVPISFVLERKTAPPLSCKVCLKLFVHALYGISGAINIYCLGLSYASATASSAIFNLLPVVAFFLAVIFGMESLNLKRFHGITKVFGVVFCIAGVIVLAFYHGPELKSFNHHHLFHHISNSSVGAISHPTRSWILGIFLTTLSTTSWALWTVLQGPMLEAYPSKLLNTTLQMLFSTIQSFFIALAVERDFLRWKLRLDAGLIAILYSGILVSGVAYYMQVWVIDKSGPVFLSMTMPITLLVTIMLSSFALGEAVTLGSILGGVIMVGGLYCVLWAKRSEQVGDKKLQVTAPVQATEGILVSRVGYYMQVWVIDKSGPVFLSMTMPINILVTIVLSSFVLGEAVSLGSILGGVTMVGGLYCVLWAKQSEQAGDKKAASDSSSLAT